MQQVTEKHTRVRKNKRSGLKVLAASGLFAMTVGGGFFLLGQMHGENLARASSLVETQYYQDEVSRQQEHLVGLQSRLASSLNGLSLRLGQLQAQMLRLNALGQQVADLALLDQSDFDFYAEVPRGGLELEAESMQVEDMVSLEEQIAALSRAMQERRWQLDVLENVLVSQDLSNEFMPRGKPVTAGWLSSHYGWRNDPFSGRRAFHHGLDFAGKQGGDVVAVAAGLVRRAERRSGYGLLVEIDHGGGYITRYGHNQEALVRKGDVVARGDVIAKIGSSGRSTGPHVHFEVIRDGKTVNPYRYVKAAK